MEIAPQAAVTECLDTLTRMSLPDASDETAFDCSLRIACHVAGMAVAVICLDATYRHWVRSELGPELRQAVQASALHEAAMAGEAPFCLADAAGDPRFASDALVTGPWQVRGFVALPLWLRGGRRIGLLCLIDPEPSGLTPAQLAGLGDVGHVIAEQIELRLQAVIDPLTGVYTRRTIGCFLEPEVARCRRHGHALSALAVDLDAFKAINTGLGRAAGDVWIRAVVSTLRAALRFSDLVARVGGEEFLVLLTETPQEGAVLVAERVRQAIAGLRLPYAAATITGTASIGVATLTRQDGQVGDLLRRVEMALNRAKQEGRNRVVFEEG